MEEILQHLEMSKKNNRRNGINYLLEGFPPMHVSGFPTKPQKFWAWEFCWSLFLWSFLADVGLPDGLQYPKTNKVKVSKCHFVVCHSIEHLERWICIYIYIYLDTASILLCIFIFFSIHLPYPFLLHLHKQKKHLSIPYMRSDPIGTPFTQPDGSAMFKTSS